MPMSETPPTYEQVITSKLTACGLRSGGFTVRYEPELQSVEIVIGKAAAASVQHIDCIREAAGYEIVTIEDPAVRKAYDERVSEALGPTILADSQAVLERHGALSGFPN